MRDYLFVVVVDGWNVNVFVVVDEIVEIVVVVDFELFGFGEGCFENLCEVVGEVVCIYWNDVVVLYFVFGKEVIVVGFGIDVDE